MVVRLLGAVLVATFLAACDGKGDGTARDLPVDRPEVAEVPVVTPDHGGDPGAEETGGADEGLPDEAIPDEALPDEGALDDGEPGPDGGEILDTPLIEAGEVAAEVRIDVGCVPDCEDRACGSDGCDGVCGYCRQGFICTVEGACKQYCEPKCEDKVCGDNGCGGECLPGCQENEECSPLFRCILKACPPRCEGKVCGPDGCGGDCGQCETGFLCREDGQCTEDTACHEVTAVGKCVGNERQWCENSVLQKETCNTGEGFVCGLDATAKKYMCKRPEVCVPQCTGKECGTDGCPGGTCGSCTEGLACSTGGKCGLACPAEYPAAGQCLDEFTLEFCHQGILVTQDCYSATPPVPCALNPENGKFDCIQL